MTKSQFESYRQNPRLTIAPGADHFTADGRAWFYLADTIWSALTHLNGGEWVAYLEKRRTQGFNALQISILPVLHDMTESAGLPEPFSGFWSGRPRFGPLLDDYARQGAEKLAIARELGFTPVLADIWCNYAPETWASRDRPEYVIGDDALEEYLLSVVEAFERFDPIHFVSGDADFQDERSIEFYARSLSRLRSLAPESLTAMHLQPWATLPDVLASSPELDIYVFQSGHHHDQQALAYTLAEGYRQRRPARPIINAEPCYEGHGYGYTYGRFDARDVRRASWQSVLSGASAGITYGAHGVWQWHPRGAHFNHMEFSGEPFDRWTALDFPGARDVAFIRRLVEELGLHAIAPAQELLVNPPPGVRGACRVDGSVLVVYVPSATALSVAVDDAVRVESWNLATRSVDEVSAAVEGGVLQVPMSPWPSDSLVVIYRGGDGT